MDSLGELVNKGSINIATESVVAVVLYNLPEESGAYIRLREGCVRLQLAIFYCLCILVACNRIICHNIAHF